ncbi:hypothetical protein PCASD_01362 [Puccinia coronata f. sp. avenae]|uniref:Uncharacterized protein n=1 Tax=Puccinia coronata f. sp. avenae TaxID=200324 RepID=A0A2N5VIY2_9BASI|nr:hypothetical protein PCASD_01362 [Puccinia coronata f. sp. avenae]
MARTYHSSNSAPQNDVSNSSAPPELPPETATSSLSAPATALVPTGTLLASATQQALSTPLAPSDRAAPPSIPAPQASNHPLATPLAPLPLRGYEEHESSMLMRLEEIDQLEMEPAYQPDQGIAPSEVFSRAPSTALASARSTPVPRPVERLKFAVSHREVPPPSMAGSMTPTGIHPSAPMNGPPRGREMSIDPLPHNQVALRGREMSIDTEIPAQDELTISNIFQGQWLLFVNAKESGNYRLMRIALNQAISTQDTLTNLFGTQRMLEVSDGWLARDELARMEQMFQIPPQPVEEQPAVRTPSRVANRDTMPPRPTQPLRLSPPVLPAHQRPAQLQPLQRAPPPPPPPPQTYGAQGQHSAYQVAAPPPAPGQMIPGTEPQPGTFQQEAQPPYPPLQYPEQEAYYGQDAYYYPSQPPHHAHYPYAAIPTRQPVPPPIPEEPPCADPMTRMLQVGSFFMRAERMINRSQRRRGRGGIAPPAYLPPNNNQ